MSLNTIPQISLLLPTRKRPKLVDRLFHSIATCTYRCDKIEVIVYVDDDDVASHAVNSTYFSVKVIKGPCRTMGGYNTCCYEASSGDIIILVNDDMEIRTPGWDDRVRQMHAEFEDEIYLGYANDLFKKSKFCTFPIMSRRTCELLGQPYPIEYNRFFIDVHLFDIFKRLQCAGVGRIRYHADIIFEHHHFRAGKGALDETYDRARRERFIDDPVFLSLIPERRDAALRLLNVIQDTQTLVNQYKGDSTTMVKAISINSLTRDLLFDSELPCMWRFFLWYWFIARTLVAQGYLKAFIKSC